MANNQSNPNGRVRASIGYVPETHTVGYRWIKVRDLLAHHAGTIRVGMCPTNGVIERGTHAELMEAQGE